jgi:hypothetical protein
MKAENAQSREHQSKHKPAAGHNVPGIGDIGIVGEYERSRAPRCKAESIEVRKSRGGGNGSRKQKTEVLHGAHVKEQIPARETRA